MNTQKYITPSEAIALHRKSGHGDVHYFTVLAWIEKYDLGFKLGGRWKIDLDAFKKFLKEGTHAEEKKEKLDGTGGTIGSKKD